MKRISGIKFWCIVALLICPVPVYTEVLTPQNDKSPSVELLEFAGEWTEEDRKAIDLKEFLYILGEETDKEVTVSLELLEYLGTLTTEDGELMDPAVLLEMSGTELESGEIEVQSNE